MKINVNGAWDASTLKAGIGVIIRNEHGSLLLGWSIYGSYNSPVESEAAAVAHDHSEPSKFDIMHIHVESDSLEVINAQNMRIEGGNWRIYPFLEEFHRHEFNHIFLVLALKRS